MILAKWLWDRLIFGGGDGRRSAKQEVKPRRTRTITHTNGGCEVNARKCVQGEAQLLYAYKKTHKSPAVILCLRMIGF
jgi:hypothetical protein